jgi:hypothetical protein
MGVPKMSKERYDSLSKGQRVAYWAVVALACAVIGYFLFLY